MGDLGKAEGIAGRGTGEVGAEDIPVSMIEETEARNVKGIIKGTEQTPLNDRVTIGDKQLVDGSRVQFKEMDLNIMRGSEIFVKGSQGTWKRKPQEARQNSMQLVEINKENIQDGGLKRHRIQGINEGGQEVQDQKENRSKVQKIELSTNNPTVEVSSHKWPQTEI